jgi:hypothetical protein
MLAKAASCVEIFLALRERPIGDGDRHLNRESHDKRLFPTRTHRSGLSTRLAASPNSRHLRPMGGLAFATELLTHGLLLGATAQAGTSPAAAPIGIAPATDDPLPAPAFPESFPRVRGERGLWFGPLQVCRERVTRAERVSDHGVPALLVAFTPDQRDALLEATRPLVGRQMTIRLNGRTIAAPMVNEPIAGGEVMITGAVDKALAKIVKQALRPC